MRVQFKKVDPEATTPRQVREGDAGFDLVATKRLYKHAYGYYKYFTGIAVEIPEGYVGLLFPRSNISSFNMRLVNSVGVIDSNYRGEIIFKYAVVDEDYDGGYYNPGDRIGQLVIVPVPAIELEEVEELSETERGDKGFGSSGR